MPKDTCFHCGLPNPEHSDYTVVINGQTQKMCCPGCQAVAQAIVDNGLESFYQHRTANNLTAQAVVPDILQELSLYDKKDLQKSFVIEESAAIRNAALILEGITCAACVWLNERHVNHLEGVIDFSVNYSTHRAIVRWDNDKIQLSTILQEILNIGYKAHPFDPNRQEQLQKKEKNRLLRQLAIAGLGMMQVMMVSIALYIGDYYTIEENLVNLLRWAAFIMASPVVFYSAQTFFISAYKDIKRKTLGMDVPVSLAIILAFIASIWATITQSGHIYFDSVSMFVFFLLGSRYLEMIARHKSASVIESLMKLLPAKALRINENNQEELVLATELQKNDQVLIKPGDTIPADGRIIKGESTVDESLLTGESFPQLKQKGDLIIAGSVNIEHPLYMQIEKTGADTALNHILRLLERAQNEKPKLAKLADHIAGYFVTILLVFATIIGITWSFIAPDKVLTIILSVLVVTCPCALSLATPTALTVATSRLTGRGILTTSGHALETLAKITDIVFDKTGTLTTGKLQLSEIKLLDNSITQEQALKIAHALEKNATHPIASAIQKALKENDLQAENIKTIAGQGVTGYINNTFYKIGSKRFIDIAIDSNEKSAVILADNQQALAIFYFIDELREDAEQVIHNLKTMGLEIHLLSGDESTVVAKLAQQLSIDNAIAENLPQDKVNYIKNLQAQGKTIAMIGDGINDAPVLSAAEVSVAMGTGTELAQASADMVLLSEKFIAIIDMLKTSKQTLLIIKQNITWAIFYNLIALPLAAIGIITPWMAAIGMSLSSLLVVLNASRLR